MSREIVSYVPYVLILIIYLILRKTVVLTHFSIPGDLLMRVAYIPYLLTYNLKLILLPYNLHSFSVRYPESLLSPTVIGSYLILLLLAVFLFSIRKQKVIVFSAGTFFITLLPVLNIIHKASVSLIAMRWLYLPMVFLTFGLVQLIGMIKEKHEKSLKQIIIIVVVIYYVVTSLALNAYLWYDQETFLKQEVLNFANELYMGDYAEMMLKKKKYRDAEPFFQRSLDIPPILARNFINYGALLIDTGRWQEALAVLERAQPLTMGYKDRIDWNNNMGAALTLIGNYERAHGYFSNALSLAPQDVSIRRNLAYLLVRKGRMKEAIEQLKISEQIKGTH